MKTGGPAFPHPTNSTLSWEGMTLRDYFAAKAMQGFVSNPNINTSKSYDDVAAVGYKIADAMLKAREA